MQTDRHIDQEASRLVLFQNLGDCGNQAETVPAPPQREKKPSAAATVHTAARASSAHNHPHNDANRRPPEQTPMVN